MTGAQRFGWEFHCSQRTAALVTMTAAGSQAALGCSGCTALLGARIEAALQKSEGSEVGLRTREDFGAEAASSRMCLCAAHLAGR